MLAILGLLSLASSAPREHDLLASVPGDAVVAVVVEDFAALWDRAQTTSWAEVVREPALDPLWPPLNALLRRKWRDDELSVEATLGALAGAAFFVRDLGLSERESVGLVLAVRPGSEALARALSAGLARRGEAVEYEGHTFTKERGGHTNSSDISFAWAGGVAIVEGRGEENALELAATMLRSLEGGATHGGLAARLSLPRPATRAAIECYVDVGRLISTNLDPGPAGERRIFEALALDDFGWAALQFTLGAGSAFDLGGSLELPRTGLAPLLTSFALPVTDTLADLAPAETIEVAALHYDVRGAWRGLRDWLAEELPDFSEDLEQGLTMTLGRAGIDVEGDLIAQLTGEFSSVLIPLSESETYLNGVMFSVLIGLVGTPGSAGADVHVVGIEDVGAFEVLVEKLVELWDADENIEEQEVGGRRMSSLAVPELPMRPTWAFTDDALLLSLYPGPVRAILERDVSGEQPVWIDRTGRRQALLAGGTSFGSSVADLEGLVKVKVAAPLAELLRRTGRGRSATAGLSPETLAGIADALPGLVERSVSGEARETLSVEGRVLRYRCWGR